MKLRRLFQPSILLILFFTPLRINGYVHADVLINAESSVTTTINPSSINVGTTALVSVRLNNVPLEGYSGAEFTCTYSGNMLEASNIIVSSLFGANPITVINGPQSGKFILAIAGNQGNKVTLSGTAFTFNVKGLQAGQVNINCTARVSHGDNFLLSLPSTGTNLSILGTVSGTATIPPTACDKAQFIADVTIPAGTLMFSGTTFRKTWRFTNVGSCDWSNYQIVFFGGEKMNTVSFAPIPTTVLVGQTVDISLDMIAPLEPGRHYGYWMFRNNNGALFGIGPLGNQAFLVDINVSSLTPTYTPPTNSPTPTFASPTYSPTPSTTPSGPTATLPPGVFFDFVANACSAIWLSGAGQQLPCPGTEGDIKGFMRKLDHPLLETGIVDSRPGILTVPQNINNGYIQGIYPPFRVQSGDRFRATIGCEDGATNCYVVYRLDYLIAGSNTLHTFWAFVEKHEGSIYSVDLDLAPLVGQDVKFSLTILSNGPSIEDRALWVNPVIYGTETDRSTSTPSPTVTSTPASTVTHTVSPTNNQPITITTTPTEDPSMITITGKVLANKTVTVDLYLLYNEDFSFTNTMITEADGSFSFAATSRTYSIRAQADGALDARGDFVLNYGEIRSMQTITLPAGDLDNNDVIDQFDALTIGMNYNTSFPTVADLNNDGIINLLDLQLLAANYQKTGPIPWQ
jgi:hypothetical protein